MKLRLIFSVVWVATIAAITGCGATGGYNLPPASRLMEPGPGVGGPGPGVLSMPTPGVQPAGFNGMAAPIVGGGAVVAQQPVQVLFARPEAMQVSFDAGGSGSYNSTPMITPARQNFDQGGIYRLKVTGIPGREGTELYPTLEIGPPTRRTGAYLAHNAIPIQFTEEDLDQVLTGNFVTKVIYLPDPDFQELALAGVETLVSTRLDPGLDPIIEADRRGAIMAVVRLGNKDMEIPGTTSASPMMMGAAHSVPGGMNQSGIMQASFVGTGCDDGSCGPAAAGGGGCMGCGGGSCPPGGCLSGLLSGGGSPAGFYGPNSTPRGGHGPGGLPPGLAAGGQYGMPITGTPIGLPGPPHIPLGVPAGLQKHVMRNWTARKIPDPVSKLKINVKQRPGLSYPQPPSRAWVTEDTLHSSPRYSHRHFGAAGGGILPFGGSAQAQGGLGAGAGACPDGSCGPATQGGGLLGSLQGVLGGGLRR